jgi:Domain of unknown function (DUF4105)
MGVPHLMTYWKRTVGYLLIVLVLGYLTTWVVFQPSHERTWTTGHQVLPQVVFDTDRVVTITGFRDFEWHTAADAQEHYRTRTVLLDSIKQVDVLISHFSTYEGIAHIFVSFGLTDGEEIVVSLEARREQGETYSPLLGMLRQYEMIYVVGSARDLINARAELRGERLYRYHTIATPLQAQALFSALADDINGIYTTPRMYHTLTHNCTNEITRKVERISAVAFPLSWKTVLPGYFDEVLYDLALIPTTDTFETTKERARYPFIQN